ncbi:hypothetical protein SAMN06265174_11186 [Dietzia kunjamensis subsp. schimae]|uniref:Uncharacterized protein n=2 Tax=Dietzia kunjamensis TaxID=322509 RepID=A0ABY1N521_9ACTN|nr:hypothetical protein SAMN06265174_11186 [Dietzia kunjamensis subsp. schimae]
MDGWSPAGVEGRIASLLETGTVGAVRDLFTYGVRILCPITLRTGRDVAGWSSWHEVAERVGAQYPPHRGLTSMIDSAGTPELAMDVDRLVGCSAGPAIEIAQRYSRTATVRQWKAAIWTVNGDPIGIPDAASIITIVDDGDYGSDYDYQLVSASTAALMDPLLHPEPSFLWSDDETLFLEVQPETGWIEVYSTGPDLVEEVRSDTKWEVVPLTRDLPQS